MSKKFQNLIENINLYAQEAQKIPNKKNLKRSSPRQIIIKMLKDKENLESRKRELTCCSDS